MIRRFERVWRNKFLTIEAKTIDEMTLILKSSADELEEMSLDGVTLDLDVSSDDYQVLVTNNPDIADKYCFYICDDDD